MISKCGGTGSELDALREEYECHVSTAKSASTAIIHGEVRHVDVKHLVGAVEFVADAAAVVVAGEAVDVVVGGGGAARFLLPVEQRGEDEEEEEPCITA